MFSTPPIGVRRRYCTPEKYLAMSVKRYAVRIGEAL
jgi:hypothetical protein